MSRLHGRSPRDWTINMDRDAGFGAPWGSLWSPAPPRYTLSLLLTRDEVNQLLDVVGSRHDGFRGYPSYMSAGASTLVRVSGLEITEEEARWIAQYHEDPLAVLLGAWPECGYRLHAVPDPLLA